MINFVLQNKNKFENILSSSSHAILIESEDELFAKNVATLFAMNLSCTLDEKPCLICSNCLKIKNKNSIDTFYYPTEDVLKIDDVNEIIDNLYIVPAENNYKVYIISNFDNVNTLLQNKLLKTIEEPPKFVKIIILAKNRQNVLPTIVSRCQCITLPKFTNHELSNFLNNDYNKNLLIEHAQGNLTKLQHLSQKPDFEDNFNLALDILQNMKSSGDLLQFSSKITQNKQIFVEIVEILSNLLQDVIYVNQNLKNLVSYKTYILQLEKLSLMFSTKAILNIQNNINLIAEKLKFNGNINIIADNMLLNILEEKWKNKQS